MRCRKIVLLAAVLSLSASGCTARTETEDIPLLQFLAEKDGQTEIDLSRASVLKVSIFHSDYPEPIQTITDKAVIDEAAEILANASVSTESTGASSTKTAVGLSFADDDGNDICNVHIQNGMLQIQDGNHTVTGLHDLYQIEGILFEDDWKLYWEEYEMHNDEYAENMQAEYPAPLLNMVNYTAQEIHERNEISDIVSVRVILDWSDMPAFETDDPQIIQSVFSALDSMQVLEPAETHSDDIEWTVILGYKVPNETFNSTCSISFSGSTLSSDVIQGNSQTFTLQGLQNLLDSADSEVFDYLKENLSSMDQ